MVLVLALLVGFWYAVHKGSKSVKPSSGPLIYAPWFREKRESEKSAERDDDSDSAQ